MTKATTTSKAIGRKDSGGKTQWSLLPWDILSEVVDVLTWGVEVKGYAPDNWKHVSDAESKYFDALMRHMSAYLSGDECDDESGEPVLAHALCNLLFLAWFEKRRVEEKERKDGWPFEPGGPAWFDLEHATDIKAGGTDGWPFEPGGPAWFDLEHAADIKAGGTD